MWCSDNYYVCAITVMSIVIPAVTSPPIFMCVCVFVFVFVCVCVCVCARACVHACTCFASSLQEARPGLC